MRKIAGALVDNHELVVVFLVFLGLLILILCSASCTTAEAVANLPEGYWLATERLALAFLQDIWDVLTFFL